MIMHTQQLSAVRIGLPLSALLGARAATDPLPDRLLLFGLGENHTSQGVFIVDDATLANLSAYQHRIGRDQVPIGFEHNCDPGSAEYERTREPRVMAARAATVEPVPGKGICLSSIQWTPEGQSSYSQYADLSPTPLYNKSTRRVYAILSASLVRTGSIYGLDLDTSAAAAMLSAPVPAGETGSGLTGLDRTVAAFAKDNREREQREARLSSGRPRLDPSLTGMARTVAANQAANERDSEYQRLYVRK
jgi:hypothetical protein